MKNFGMFVLAFGLVSGSAMASGFKCEGQGYNVKLYNLTSSATRKPAVLVVSHDDASPRTLLTAKGAEITKTNRLNTVRYTVDGVAMDMEQVILQISFKEGQEKMLEGEIVPGQLILVNEAGTREVIRLDCKRYLKGN